MEPVWHTLWHADENQLTLADIARLCDIFYIGGTKCGALFGEAVVILKPDLIPHFFTIIKQHWCIFCQRTASGDPVRYLIYRFSL